MEEEEERCPMSQQVEITLFLKKVDLNDLQLCLTFHYNITGRSQRQVPFFQWQGIGPARTWRSAATATWVYPLRRNFLTRLYLNLTGHCGRDGYRMHA